MHHNNNDDNLAMIRKCYLKYTFTVNYKQINRIHITTLDKMRRGVLYFAKYGYPIR